jgi:aspartate carbamoyltransferase catalytic subunit
MQKWGSLEGKTISIVGDIRNSRVANSDIELFTRFGANVILVGPPQFLPKTNIKTTYNLKEAIEISDAIISLRTQTERHQNVTFASLEDYAQNFKITKKLIKDKNIFIMHPGPVHRNIDIDDEVLADKRCLVLKQVKNGVAVRMGILKFLLG